MCVAPHATLKANRELFAQLAFVGLQVTEADSFGPREVLALSNCSCGSTLSFDVTDEHPESK